MKVSGRLRVKCPGARVCVCACVPMFMCALACFLHVTSCTGVLLCVELKGSHGVYVVMCVMWCIYSI